MAIPVWFHATKEGTYDLLCAELCGWGHYKMRGILTVHSASGYEQWLNDQQAEQEVTE
jgi:cytochrome c oxidase subunit 2